MWLVTHLKYRVTTLEAKKKLANSDYVTIQRLLKKLETLDSDFQKSCHFTVMDLKDDDETG